MRNETSLWKRSLAGLLCFVMVLGMIPAIGTWVAKAAEDDAPPAVADDHITMPITIRDFAADGMLFEYNETGDSGIAYKGTTNPTIPVYYNVKVADNGWENGHYRLGYAYVLRWADNHDYVDDSAGSGWHIIFVSSDGSIDRVYPKGTDSTALDKSIPNNGMVIYAYGGDGATIDPCNNYDYFAGITNSTKANYSFSTTVASGGATGYYLDCTKHEAVYHQADTKGFGMLYTDVSDFRNNIYLWLEEGSLKGSLVAWNRPGDVTSGTTLTKSYTISDVSYILDGVAHSYDSQTYSYEFQTPYKEYGIWDNDGTGYANQHVYGATIRTNLMQRYLVDGKPIYTTYAVDYIVDYLRAALETSWQNADGSYNTFYVTGDKVADGDTLANKIRTQIAQNGDKMGTYQDSYDKFFNDNGKAGDGLDHYSDIVTWYDAAFFLMHNTWRDSTQDDTDPGDDGYGKLAPEYHSMHLIAKEQEDGSVTYVFNSMYDNAVYNPTTGEIYNTQIENSTKATVNGVEQDADGNPQPVARFDPLGEYGTGLHGTPQILGYGIKSPDTYGDMITASTDNWNEYYDETNYHLSLEGHAQFVYQYDADQYFTFTGDDDVYLYINGQRVLDIGGGHSIAKVGIRLNDVAKNIGLENGKTYDFDFFYMERHGTAANFGIETNIQIADPSMHTTKQGFQNGVNTGYGGPVNADNHVGYTFEIQNDGTANIYNLTFNDPTIGVYVGWDDILLNQEKQKKEDGTDLYTLANDIYLIYWDDDGTRHYYEPGSFTEQELKDRLKLGLKPGERLGVYGFKYKIKTDQWKDAEDGAEQFINTVYTSANSESDGTGTTLQGVADWKVVKMEHPYTAFRVYDWLHKGISNDPSKTFAWTAPTTPPFPDTPINVVTVPKADLITKYLLNGESSQDLSNVNKDAIEIKLCTAAGNEDEYFLQGSNASKDAETGGITYTSTNVGKDTVFFKFKNVMQNGAKVAVYDSLVFSYEVFTYGAVDNIYVLDYGLPVELAGEEFGFYTNDHLLLNENNREMTIRVTDMVDANGNSITSKQGAYGSFDWNKEQLSLKYTPTKIINGTDDVYAKVQIKESTAEGAPTMYTGVEMVQKITTAPASVMYYEENFPGITYVSNTQLKVNEDGYLLNKEGAAILHNTKKVKVVNGYLEDETGAQIKTTTDNKPIKVNAKGELVDEQGNLIQDENIKISPVVVAADGKNAWVYYETVDAQGNPVKGTEQSANQETNYGSDPNYAVNKGGTDEEGRVIVFTANTESPNEAHKTLVQKLAKFLGLAGEDSNGTYNKLEVKEYGEVMSFEFKGTGFEILSRTTDEEYALIQVKVILLDEVNGTPVTNPWKADGTAEDPALPGTDAEGVCYSQILFTESKGGDLYQVPIIAVKDLPRHRYKVTVTASYHEKKDRVLYIDGIRIYGPLSNTEALDYYNPQELGAKYYEIKNLIGSYNAIFAELININQSDPELITGTTRIENTGTGNFVLTNENKDGNPVSLTDYLSVGPNNEIYLDGYTTKNLIAFFLEPDTTIPEDQRTIQIGAHRKADSLNKYTGKVGFYYGSTVASLSKTDITEQPYYHEVKSGTEQYFDIDVKHLYKAENEDRYLVMIVAGESDAKEVLALTNLKIKGYEVEFLQPEFMAANANGTLAEHEMIRAVAEVLGVRFSEKDEENVTGTEGDTELGNVNQDLVITSADLDSKSVVSGMRASLAVSASLNAKTIEVRNSKNEIVTSTNLAVNEVNGEMLFSFMWRVYGNSGDKQVYTVRVLDAEGKYSANTMTVTVTIK